MSVNALPVYQNDTESQPLSPAQTSRAHTRPDGHGRPVPEEVPRGTTPGRSADPLRQGYIELLSRYNWNLFGTLTWRESVHPERADKAFRYYIAVLNRRLYGPRWHKRGVGIAWARAIEMQQRDVIHFHCLLADPHLEDLLSSGWYRQQDGRWANELNELWNKIAGFARIETVNVQELVGRYVSKYVVKGGDIDFGGPLNAGRLPYRASGSPHYKQAVNIAPGVLARHSDTRLPWSNTLDAGLDAGTADPELAE